MGYKVSARASVRRLLAAFVKAGLTQPRLRNTLGGLEQDRTGGCDALFGVLEVHTPGNAASTTRSRLNGYPSATAPVAVPVSPAAEGIAFAPRSTTTERIA